MADLWRGSSGEATVLANEILTKIVLSLPSPAYSS